MSGDAHELQMRIGLGTAQFGSPYGITNKGQPSRKECEKIVETALDAGIVYFDTAAYYGEADLILSSLLPSEGVRVVTKVKTPSEVQQSVDLFGRNLWGILSDRFIAEGIRSGISVYWPIKIDPTAQIVQMPLNIADPRNLPLLRLYKAQDTEVHARSVFLQGLLLQRGATIRQCLKYVLDKPVDVALVGVNSADELKEILEAVETLEQEKCTDIPFIEPEMLDPRGWPNANN